MYTLNQITGVSLLGGPFSGVYLIAKNFSLMEMPKERKATELLGYGLALIAMIGAIYLPENAPGVVYAGILAGIIRLTAKNIQDDLIAAQLKEGRLRASNWKCFGIGILFLICTFVIGFALIIVLDMFAPGVLPEWLYQNA